MLTRNRTIFVGHSWFFDNFVPIFKSHKPWIWCDW